MCLVGDVKLEEDELLEKADARRRRTQQIATTHLLIGLYTLHTDHPRRQQT